MRVLAPALAAMLLVAICSLAEADPSVSRSAALSKKNGFEIPVCCLSYISRPIRRSMITSAYVTSNLCSVPAVVLITRKGREICANPSAGWVQKFLEDLELQVH
ncbi:C-C motif chemokine 5-like [Motacilla alba alba]|uniref:C-C motif chemokine 5-like n=1 Tax=Motacilla alba alba TaxID=1094192 RepID=UPI0018D59174|nr:C-C motif chemokine 5-like [Motacilla alba alba]